jgi:hypothetical protein
MNRESGAGRAVDLPWHDTDTMFLKISEDEAPAEIPTIPPAKHLAEFRSFPDFSAGPPLPPEESSRDLESEWARAEGKGVFSITATILLAGLGSLVGWAMLVQAFSQ